MPLTERMVFWAGALHNQGRYRWGDFSDEFDNVPDLFSHKSNHRFNAFHLFLDNTEHLIIEITNTLIKL